MDGLTEDPTRINYVAQTDLTPMNKPLVSSIEYTRIAQQSGGTTVTQTTSAVESVFELPARVINFSKSSLMYTIVVPDPGATPKYNWIWGGGPAIRQIQLYSRSGVMLCDINNLQNYLGIITPLETKKDDCGMLDETTAPQITGLECRGAKIANIHPAGSTNDNNMYEPLYLSKLGLDTTATTVNYAIRLSLIKNSIFSLDKDLFFNETMLIKIVWNVRDAVGFYSAAEDGPETTPGVLSGDVAISKLYLYLAMERNPLLAAAVIATVQNTGMIVNCPYVYSFKNIPGASTSQNISIRLNRSNGTHLKKIIHSILPATETLNNRFDRSTVVTSYYTSLNNQRLQQFDLVASDQLDFMYNYENCKDSMINNLDTYNHNWFHLDKFEDNLSTDPNSNVASGIPLSIEQKYDINVTCAATAYNHYTFCITNRLLVISPQGIVFN